jgi:hypothetical protein
VFNNLVIGTIAFALVQPTSAASFKPMTDPDAYAIYATLLPKVRREPDVRRQPEDVILLIQETMTTIQCIPPLPKGWEDVRKDFGRQTVTSWMLQAIVPTDAYYRLVPKAEIESDDARLERQYPGGWQRRPGSLDFVAVSAVGFNRDKTKALVSVQTRSSFRTYMLERQRDKWVGSKEGVTCGGIA